MAKKSTTKSDSTPQSKEHAHADLEKKIESLEKEVAALKKQLSEGGSAGEDPRVSKIWEALSSLPRFSKILNK